MRTCVFAALSAFILAGCLAGTAAGGEGAPTVIPRAGTAPVLDGELTDACWKDALLVEGFTKPESADAPAKKVSARMCFDDEALYVAFQCEEPEPAKLRTRQPDGEQVWQDDCVEFWIRTTADQGEFDQFIVNPLARRESLHKRVSNEPWRHDWQAGAKVGAADWRAEMRIPFRTLGIATPKPGHMAQVKLGREDHTSPAGEYGTWPPGSHYAGAEDYRAAYFETDNLLRNPDLSGRAGGRVEGWSFTKGDDGLFTPVAAGGRKAVRFDCPGRYATMQQSLSLEPDSLYRIEADVKGAAGIYIRARTTKPGDKSPPPTVDVKPQAEFARQEMRFTTGPKGDALIIIGTSEGRGTGAVEIAGLRLAREVSSPSSGEAIPVAADAASPLVVRKLLVADCRAVRGFVGAPVDGTLASGDWAGNVWEYNQPEAGAGVGYDCLGNDGLHIRLADSGGFNAVVIRGGVKAKLWRDCASFESPAGGALVAEFPGRAQTSRWYSKKPVQTARVSFWEVTDGQIANASFFRVEPGGGGLAAASARLAVGKPAASAPEELAARFKKDEQLAYELVPAAGGGGGGGAVEMPAGKAVHLISAPLEKETALAAVGLDLVVSKASAPCEFTASVQDPANPRSELYGADFALSQSGRLRLVLDFPDVVVPAGRRLWVSLRFEKGAQLSGAGGAAPAVELYEVARQSALPEALAYRKLLAKTYFCALSEARPWYQWYTDEDIAKALAGKYGPQLRELREAIDLCMALAPEDQEVKELYEWVWRQYRPWRKERNRGIMLDASHAKVAAVAGAPEWAVVARQAWLEARKVPQWWLDNRLAPTGEFGGVVGDDTDMYGNYADFVMFETDGVAAGLRDAAARLAELAEKTTLASGLNSRTMDPLHAYEEGVNHEAQMAWWFYGDPVYMERCMVAAKSTAEALTVLTPKGHRHFKSQDCGASDLKMDRKTDKDGQAHPLMWHPSLEVAWYNANPQVVKWLREWADGWLDHMEPGKYATGVEVATEKVVETSDQALGGIYGGQGSVFEFLWWATGDDRYIGPFMTELANEKPKLAPGGILPELWHRGKLSALEARLPELMKGGVGETLVTGKKDALVDALKRDIAEMQNYGRMYTTIEPFTDRVFLYAISNASVAYTGGFCTRNKLCHAHAASYDGFGTNYAALVLAARPDRFKVLIYSFAKKETAGRVRLWSLEHGVYRLTQGVDSDGDDSADKAERSESVEVARATAVPVSLPPGKVTVLDLVREKPLEDIRSRADLALSPLDIKVDGGAVTAVAHNIGSAAAEVEVALVDPAGKVRDRKRLGPLAAPTDLAPKRIEFRLQGVPGKSAGWAVVIDPDGRVSEIFEGNNRVELAPARR